MARLKGITILLYEKTKIGTDEFNRPVYEEMPMEIEDVLVAPVSVGDVIDKTNLNGKKETYILAIPKGDTNEWTDRTVEFFGKKWRTSGPVQEGIESLIPLRWNRKVTVERYG